MRAAMTRRRKEKEEGDEERNGTKLSRGDFG